MRSVRTFLVLLAASGLLALVVACRPNETVEGQTRDAKIKAQIKSKLASDVGASTLTALSVDVTNGVVTLAGPVHSDEEKSRVESVARAVEGVVSVNNALQVQAAAPPPPSGMSTAGPAFATTPSLTPVTPLTPLPASTPMPTP